VQEEEGRVGQIQGSGLALEPRAGVSDPNPADLVKMLFAALFGRIRV
jgi:hypothetical protein